MFASLFRAFARRAGWAPNAPSRPQARRPVPGLTVLEDRSLPSASPVAHVVAFRDTPAFSLEKTEVVGSAARVNPFSHAAEILGFATTTSHGSASKSAGTQVLPFKITGEGDAPDGLPVFEGGTGPHTATGTATGLGRYTGEGLFKLVSLNFETLSGEFSSEGPFLFTAANGDVAAFHYGDPDAGAESVGTFQLIPTGGGQVYAVFLAEFTLNPEVSTGRFAGAAGSFIMVCTSEPFDLTVNEDGYTPGFTYTWEGEGWIEIAHGKGKK